MCGVREVVRALGGVEVWEREKNEVGERRNKKGLASEYKEQGGGATRGGGTPHYEVQQLINGSDWPGSLRSPVRIVPLDSSKVRSFNCSLPGDGEVHPHLNTSMPRCFAFRLPQSLQPRREHRS